VQCTETAALHLLFFELLPFVIFHISFLSWPFPLNYIVHKATHPTRGVLVTYFDLFLQLTWVVSVIDNVWIASIWLIYNYNYYAFNYIFKIFMKISSNLEPCCFNIKWYNFLEINLQAPYDNIVCQKILLGSL
jgi:hypothetical protein